MSRELFLFGLGQTVARLAKRERTPNTGKLDGIGSRNPAGSASRAFPMRRSTLSAAFFVLILSIRSAGSRTGIGGTGTRAKRALGFATAGTGGLPRPPEPRFDKAQGPRCGLPEGARNVDDIGAGRP